MAYIDIKYIGQCETCRHDRSGKCDVWCENGEFYSPNLSKIPTADFVETKHGKWDYIATHDCFSCNICKFDSDVVMKYCGGCGAKMDLSEKLTGCGRKGAE